MKRCHYTHNIFVVLFVALFFFLTSCGIPTFYNLDNEIMFSANPRANSFTITGLDDDRYSIKSKIVEYGATNPSVKLFYVLSSAENTLSDYHETLATQYRLSEVITAFNKYIRGERLNGRFWSPKKESAPGFYLYTNSSNTHRQFSDQAPLEGQYATDPIAGMLVGTFASFKGNDVDQESSSFTFGSFPQMDVELNFFNSLTHTMSFSLLEENDEGHIIQMEYEGDTYLLRSYTKNLFPANKEGFVTSDTKQDFYQILKEDDNLYITIYAAIFGGKGSFTNMYWSPLKEVGRFTLY